MGYFRSFSAISSRRQLWTRSGRPNSQGQHTFQRTFVRGPSWAMMRFYFFHSPTGNVDRATSLAKNPWYYPLYCKLAKANLKNLFSLPMSHLKVRPAASISDVVIVQPEPPATLPRYNVLTITVHQLKQNSEHRNFQRNCTQQQDLRLLVGKAIALLVGAWTFIDYEISWPWISIWCNMNSI